MTRLCGGVAFVAMAMAAISGQARADPAATYDYVVKHGDDCVSIAAAQLGGWSRYVIVHKLNPQLGSLPHNLKPGSILKLPARDRGAEATLTAARGIVEVRKPAEPNWNPAQSGMELFRSWRLGVRGFSSAEATFRDTTRLFLRDNTIAIVYGATAQRTAATDAELETGTLEIRLAAISRRRLVIHTQSAETALVEGTSLVKVDATGATVVANYGGKPATVLSVDGRHRPRGVPVQVSASMGLKIRNGKSPSKPRSLPAAPAWQRGATRFVAMAGSGASVAAQWSATPVAVRYHLVVRTADGQDVAAADVAAPATSVELHRLPPGDYTATIAAIDSEGFESLPSPVFAFDVVGVVVFAPGASEPAASLAAGASNAAVDPTSPSPVVSLARGSRILAGGNVVCSAGGTAATSTVITDVAATSLRCESDGVALPPVPIRVIATGTCTDAACDHGPASVPVRRDAPATVSALGLELGAFGGYWIVPGTPSLGRPHDSTDAISNGPVGGLRATALLYRAVGFELEGFAAQTRDSGGLGSSTILGWRGHLIGGLQRGAFSLRLLVGGGTSSLVNTSGQASRDTVGVIDVGGAATINVGAGWLLRLDARDALVPRLGSSTASGLRGWFDRHTGIIELYFGLSRAFWL